MQLLVEVAGFFRDALRDVVRVDRFLPIADTREDMRRHMLCVRGVGRDLGVEPRRIKALLGDRRIVVEMDQVVRDAGMLRLALKDRLQDRRSLELVGIGLVGRPKPKY